MGLPEGVSPTGWVYADVRPRTAAETRAVMEKRIVGMAGGCFLMWVGDRWMGSWRKQAIYCEKKVR